MTVIGGKNYSARQVARLFGSKTKTAQRQLWKTGHQCPDCGAGYARIEDNGEADKALAFICNDCGWQWDAADIEI
jgi:predicted RNA-binding Zn-ribbon protein involved in translation (DUF1610 family)